MLDSVICGRDKYLSDNGMMAPSQTTIQLAAYGDDEFYNDHLSFWNDVYGFKMSALKHSAVKNAYITTALPAEIISSIACIQLINTKAVTAEQLDFGSDFTLNITGGSKIYAFCGWFDTIFDGDGVKKNMFSTSPFTKKTHWMQTLFLLEEPLKVNAGDVIRGKIVVSKMFKNLREIQIDITYALQAGEEKFQTFYVT